MSNEENRTATVPPVAAEPSDGDERLFDMTLECVGRAVSVTFTRPQIDALVGRLKEFDLIATTPQPAEPAVSERPGPSGDAPSSFQEGQWWLKKLDEVAACGTDDFKRAVAVVRNLMRTAHAQAASAGAASLAVPEGWQPIETAPQTGRTILLGYFNALGKWRTLRGQWFTDAVIQEEWSNSDVHEAGWFETSVECDDEDSGCWSTDPTHWMPLPAAPSQLTAEEREVRS